MKAKRKFPVVIKEAPEGGYWATCPKVPGANGPGKTVKEAKDNLRQAIRRILGDRLKRDAKAIAEALRLARNPRWREALMIDEEVASTAMELFGDQAGRWFMSQPIPPYRLMAMARDPKEKSEVIAMLRKQFDEASKYCGHNAPLGADPELRAAIEECHSHTTSLKAVASLMGVDLDKIQSGEAKIELLTINGRRIPGK